MKKFMSVLVAGCVSLAALSQLILTANAVSQYYESFSYRSSAEMLTALEKSFSDDVIAEIEAKETDPNKGAFRYFLTAVDECGLYVPVFDGKQFACRNISIQTHDMYETPNIYYSYGMDDISYISIMYLHPGVRDVAQTEGIEWLKNQINPNGVDSEIPYPTYTSSRVQDVRLADRTVPVVVGNFENDPRDFLEFVYDDVFVRFVCETTVFDSAELLKSFSFEKLPLNEIEPGDVNNDGAFNIADVVLFQKWLLGVPDAKIADWKAADLNEDGKYDAFDFCLMKKKLLKGELTSNSKNLTLDDVLRLSEKGNELDWSDFEGYKHEDVGSGLYILKYDIGDGYALFIGGDPWQSPFYIELRYDELRDISIGSCIDIRTEDVQGFIDANTLRYVQALDADDISRVTVRNLPPDKTVELNKEQITEMLYLLNGVIVSGRDDSFNEYNGHWAEFSITCNNGKEISFAVFDPFFIINGRGYMSKYESCQALDSFALSLIKEEPAQSPVIKDGYIAVFHGDDCEIAHETYIYKLDNGAANYGFEYINVEIQGGEPPITSALIVQIGSGKVMWTDNVFEVAEANHAYDYVTIPNDDKIYTIEEFMNMFLMN